MSILSLTSVPSSNDSLNSSFTSSSSTGLALSAITLLSWKHKVGLYEYIVIIIAFLLISIKYNAKDVSESMILEFMSYIVRSKAQFNSFKIFFGFIVIVKLYISRQNRTLSKFIKNRLKQNKLTLSL